ncbi:hypothetical protein [Denitratimonas sp. CY0512]|uniref:hypothetical protein n=1 Tax=Denitratimonas sp. CY0512 TaxID=3131940 RepID=UPI00309E847A
MHPILTVASVFDSARQEVAPDGRGKGEGIAQIEKSVIFKRKLKQIPECGITHDL